MLDISIIIKSLFPAPPLTLVITPSGPTIERQAYSLSCDLTGDESLAVTNRRFRWDRLTFQEGILQERILTFNSLTRDDEGQYRCTTTITSLYLNRTRSENALATISVNRKCHLDQN